MKPKYLIYVLINPIDQRHFYVGKSCNGLNRPKQHFNPNLIDRSKNKHKVSIIRNIIKAGLKPEIDILEVLSNSKETNEAEKEWIAEYRRVGIILTNITDGGDGQTIGYRHSQEAKIKMSLCKSGERHPNYGKKGPLCPNYGKKHSQATKDILSKKLSGSNSYLYGKSGELNFMFGKKHSIDYKKALSKKKGGKPFLNETTGKIYYTLNEAASEAGNLSNGGIHNALKRVKRNRTGVSYRYLTDDEIKDLDT